MSLRTATCNLLSHAVAYCDKANKSQLCSSHHVKSFNQMRDWEAVVTTHSIGTCLFWVICTLPCETSGTASRGSTGNIYCSSYTFSDVEEGLFEGHPPVHMPGQQLDQLLLAAPGQVIFTWNEGESWYDFKVTNTPFEVPKFSFDEMKRNDEPMISCLQWKWKWEVLSFKIMNPFRFFFFGGKWLKGMPANAAALTTPYKQLFSRFAW